MSLRKIDPLQFVKSPMPLLSADTRRAPERALGRLEDAAARDEACVWQRVSEHDNQPGEMSRAWLSSTSNHR